MEAGKKIIVPISNFALLLQFANDFKHGLVATINIMFSIIVITIIEVKKIFKY